MLAACVPPGVGETEPPRELVNPRTPTRPIQHSAQAHQIVSAQWVVDEVGPPHIYLVFSAPLDASSLDPRRFVVALSDGTRALPEAASFAPASEVDELHTVRLRLPAEIVAAASNSTRDSPVSNAFTGSGPDTHSGGGTTPADRDTPGEGNGSSTREVLAVQEGDAGRQPNTQDDRRVEKPDTQPSAPVDARLLVTPVSVTLAGILHTQSGDVVEGLSSTVAPATAIARPVWAQWMLPEPGRCAGHAQVVRLYWSQPLPADGPVFLGEASAMAEHLVATLQTGKSHRPAGFDDVIGERAATGHSPRVDNVLDLCFDQPAKVAVVEVRSDGVHRFDPVRIDVYDTNVLLPPAVALQKNCSINDFGDPDGGCK